MADEGKVVDVWVGRFANEQAADAYFEETYADPVDDEEDFDEPPISPFAADMGQPFYDHDWVEWSFHADGMADLADALAGHSFSSSYVASVVDEAAARDDVPDPFNLVLLVWNRAIEAPVSVRTATMTLAYVGRFDCDPTAPAVDTEG